MGDKFKILQKQKKASYFYEAFSLKKERQRLTLPHVIAVPSALAGLTSLFGMGRGEPHRYSHLKTLRVFGFRLQALILFILKSINPDPISLTCCLAKE